MDIEIIRDQKNDLLGRREVSFTLQFEGPTPSRKQVSAKLAALLNAKESLLVVDHLTTRFGKSEVVGAARIYNSEEELGRTEHEYLSKRGVAKVKEEAS